MYKKGSHVQQRIQSNVPKYSCYQNLSYLFELSFLVNEFREPKQKYLKFSSIIISIKTYTFPSISTIHLSIHSDIENQPQKEYLFRC